MRFRLHNFSILQNMKPLIFCNYMKIICALFYLLLSVTFASGQISSKDKEISLITASHTQVLFNLSVHNQELKNLNNVSVKIFLKIEMANFIWRRKIIGGKEIAEDLMEEAIQNLQRYKTEIPEFYKNSFQTNIISSLKINSPAFFQKISKKYNLKEDEYIQGYKSISDYKNSEASKAIDEIKKALTNPNTSSNKLALVFIVKELLANNKTAEANSILELILASEENSDVTSYLLLLYLSETYTSQKTPSDLQKKFLKLVITAGYSILQKSSLDAVDLEKRQNLYQILKNNLPKIELLLPLEFPQILALMGNLRKGLLETFKEREDINDRIDQSEDELKQTISEAEKTNNKQLKNGLWQQAAQLALEKKKFQLAVDCLEKVEADDEHFSLWHDQFLGDVTESSLKEKDLDSAEYAAAHIKSKLHSGLATLQIVKFHYKNKDTLNTQLTLNESLKKIRAADNDAQQVRGLSNALGVAFVVDKVSVFEIIQSIIKTVNSLSPPNEDEKPDSELRKKYVNDVEMVIAWNLFPVFQKLAKHDSVLARNITSNFNERQYRLISSVAAEIGGFDAENVNKQNEKVTSKK